MATRARSTVVRRYPALGFLGVAAALALLLPSALHVPLSGPTGQAEVAPVSGRSNAAGDLSSLGAASSGGLGAGLGSGGGSVAGVGSRALSQAAQRHANTKRCVGKPLRQTEDPLSPPCVPYFDGDNGGATAPRGVTSDEITVVVYGGIATNVNPRGFNDWEQPPSTDDTAFSLLGKGLAHHFNERYQTYGRRVHFFSYFGGGLSPEQLRDAVQKMDEKQPFAIVNVGEATGGSVVVDEGARRQILVTSYGGFTREQYRRDAPYVMSRNPDLEDQAEQYASYLCAKVVGGNAVHAPDQTMRARQRVLGLVYDDRADARPSQDLWGLLRDALARRCNAHFAVERPIGSGASHAQLVTFLRTSNVTTVVEILDSGSSNLSHEAAVQGYLPEWFLAGGGAADNGDDHNESGRLHDPSTWQGAFGLTFDVRRDAPSTQPWYGAFREGCPDCDAKATTTGTAYRLYDTLALLMYGIQSAGPRLAVANIDKGLHAIRPRASDDPYAPAAYFAPGNWSFVKDAMVLWWDPAGRAPGESASGCYRLVADGHRRRAGEWSSSDPEPFADGPCQGDVGMGAG